MRPGWKAGLSLLVSSLLLVGCWDKGPMVQEPDYRPILPALQATTQDWNRGDLDSFISLYDSSATFMLKSGPVGVAEMKQHYARAYFAPGKKRQRLSFDDLKVRPLGPEYALVTGRYLLSGNGEPEHSGRYSLVFHRTPRGWKILHDHSS